MKHPAMSVALRGAAAAIGLLCAVPSSAYEYRLAFTPIGNYKDLVVAGYHISGGAVIGDCSYTRITSGSGRDPKTIYTPIPQTCTWDLYGALLSTVAGEPVAPAPIAVDGTRTVYAGTSTKLYTGADSAYPGGFVFRWGSHETWLTSNGYLVLPPGPYTFTATVASDGDASLGVRKVTVTTANAGTHATIVATTCGGYVAPGATCDVTVSYDFSKLRSPSGLAYDTLTLHLASNAGQANDFVQSYTLEVPVGDPGG